jgi:hypothetical protein
MKAEPIGHDTSCKMDANVWAAVIQEYNDHNGQESDSDSEYYRLFCI